jgi:hypothetical protein
LGRAGMPVRARVMLEMGRSAGEETADRASGDYRGERLRRERAVMTGTSGYDGNERL